MTMTENDKKFAEKHDLTVEQWKDIWNYVVHGHGSKDVIDIYAAAQKRKDAKREQSSLESDLQTVNLARAIMDMAERDKGLILSTLVDLIEMYHLDEAVADHDEIYIKGYEDGYAKGCKDSDAIRREPFAQWAEQHKDKAKPDEYVYFTWAKKDNGYDV